MNNQRGFTLIETLIAIFLLTLTVGALLQLAAGGFYSVRYARNQLVANTLLQESLEFVRNDRDNAALAGVDGRTWVEGYSVNINGTPTGGTNSGCFSSDGCRVDPYATSPKVRACGSECPAITFYSSSGLYGYSDSSYPSINGRALGTGAATSYVRTVTMQVNTPNQITVNATVTWLNGTARKTATQSILLTNWR